MTHRWISALLALALFLPAGAAAEFYDHMPALLCFSQETTTREIEENVCIRITLPHTASETVNSEMAGLLLSMEEANRPLLPAKPADAPSFLDVGAVISRSGESLLSFLALAEVTRDKQMLAVDVSTRVYDTATGARVSLGDLFKEEALSFIAGQVRSTLSAAFPGEEMNAAALDALCTPQAIAQADFTLGAARLTLSYRADALFAGKQSLLHVNIGYSRLRGMMTPYGLRQTDNSRFQMLALTYDDGPVRASTRGVLDALRAYGAQATFFVVGERFDRAQDMLLREQNGNYSIQSHSYSHKYPEQMTREEPFAERARMEAALGNITGVLPTMMRAPGGHADYYAIRGVGYPMIQWNLASGDSGNPHIDQIARKVIDSADDGEIALLHDLNGGSPKYTQQILDALTKKGFLFVTVEELFEDAGVPLRENTVYYSPYQTER